MKAILISLLFVPLIVSADDLDIPTSQSQVIKVTDRGVEPLNLVMPLEDSILFVLNETSNSPIKVAVDFGGKTTHCASANLSVAENTALKSKKPVSPNDFASMCFHDKGQYPYEISGLQGKIVKGTITVE